MCVEYSQMWVRGYEIHVDARSVVQSLSTCHTSPMPHSTQRVVEQFCSLAVLVSSIERHGPTWLQDTSFLQKVDDVVAGRRQHALDQSEGLVARCKGRRKQVRKSRGRET